MPIETKYVCPKCHMELPENSKFCLNCGEKIIANVEYSDSQLLTESTPEEILQLQQYTDVVGVTPKHKWNKYKMQILIIFVLLLIIISGIIILLIINKHQKNDNAITNDVINQETTTTTPTTVSTTVNVIDTLTSDEKYIYESLISASAQFKNPSSVRIIELLFISQESGFYANISATNGLGATTKNLYSISDYGYTVLELDISMSLSIVEDENISISKINTALQKHWDELGLS